MGIRNSNQAKFDAVLLPTYTQNNQICDEGVGRCSVLGATEVFQQMHSSVLEERNLDADHV